MLNIILNVMGGSVTFTNSVICFVCIFIHFVPEIYKFLAFSTNFPFGQDFHDRGQVQRKVFSI